MIEFLCNLNNKEQWTGSIIAFKQFASHYEMTIHSRSRLNVIFGSSLSGGFACLPDYHACCYLNGLNDKFWNTEKLIKILGDVDGITVANALYSLADRINLKKI